jgi:hypothetical protein
MRAWLIIAALALAGPALAVPPIPPSLEALKVSKAFIQATADNDLAAYGALLAPDAQIVTGAGVVLDKPQWLSGVAREFHAGRSTEVLQVVGSPEPGPRSARVLVMLKVRNCTPMAAECFASYRTEAIVIRDGAIIRLERSPDYSAKLTLNGAVEATDW